jgi:hypothetical protein
LHLVASGWQQLPIEDAVGDARIADLFVPVRHRHLRGQNHGAALVSVITEPGIAFHPRAQMLHGGDFVPASGCCRPLSQEEVVRSPRIFLGNGR